MKYYRPTVARDALAELGLVTTSATGSRPAPAPQDVSLVR